MSGRSKRFADHVALGVHVGFFLAYLGMLALLEPGWEFATFLLLAMSVWSLVVSWAVSRTAQEWMDEQEWKL